MMVQNSTKMNQSSTNSFYIHQSGFYRSRLFNQPVNWNLKSIFPSVLETSKSNYLYKPHSLSSTTLPRTSRAIRMRT
jgi:hypothetical protein